MTSNTQTKADWLRSEIEKLEGMKEDIYAVEDESLIMMQVGHNTALTSIITRYKEELKELTGE